MTHPVTITPWFDSVMMQHNMQHLKKLEVGVVATLTFEFGILLHDKISEQSKVVVVLRRLIGRQTDNLSPC